MIKTKLDSIKFIEEKNLNRFRSIIIKSYIELMGYFVTLSCRVIPPVLFSIRHNDTKPGPARYNQDSYQTFNYCFNHFIKAQKKHPLTIIELGSDLEDQFTINCEILIRKNGRVDAHFMKGNFKMRPALKHQNSIHVVNQTLAYRPLRWAIDYYCKHIPLGHVAELTLFSKRVGVLSENIVCWEVRDY